MLTIRVLYAEDNPFDAELIQSKFRQKAPHFELEIVASAKDCLEKVESSHYDVLLLDHQLPDMDGLQLITEIRKMNVDVPIVLFTGAGDESIVVKALKIGASDYIRKNAQHFGGLPSILQDVVSVNHQKKKLGLWILNEPRKILYVEDDPAVVDLTLQHLSAAAPLNQIRVATTCEQAFRLLERESFDLVIMDLSMPDMTGLDFLNETRHRGFRVPFIVLTDKKDEDSALAALKLGAYDLIFKRDNYLEELTHVIQSVITHHMLLEKTEELEFEIYTHKKTLSQLQQAEEKYRSLVERVPAIVYVAEIGASGKWHYVSPQIETILGFSVPEWINTPKLWASRIHPEDRDRALALDTRVGVTGEPLIAEYRLLSKSGRPVWFRDEGVIVLKKPGHPVLIQGVMLDISERKEAEQALAASEKRLHTIVDTEPECVKVVGLDGNLLEMNPAGLAMIEVEDSDDIVGSSLMPFVAPEFRESFAEITARAFKGESGRLQFAMVGSKGTRRWVESYVTPLRNDRNEITSVLGITRDITEQRQSMEALQESVEALSQSEEKYRKLFEESKDVIFIATPEGRFVDINPAGVELFGYDSKEEILGINIYSDLFLNSEDWEMYVRKISQKGYLKDHDLSLKKKDGSKLFVCETSTVLRDENGRPTAYRGILHDVTQLKELQQQLLHSQKIEAIGQLAGGVAHDFNNILMAIGTYCELLLLTGKQEEPSHSYLLEIQKAFERGSALTKQLLAFSRRQLLSPTTLLLNEIIINMQSMLLRLIGENIELVVVTAPELSYIHADRSQVEQVILNLVINARDAMQKPGKLIIETQVQDFDEEYTKYHHGSKPGRYVMLAVSDTGHGMDEATKARIFEPFYTTKEQGKGTGLGLSTVYGIVQQSGGYIMVHSEEGLGSTFQIYLPALDQGPAAIQDSAAPPSAASTGETLLLVDDSDSAREGLASYLRMKGYDVITAKDGMEAIEKSNNHGGEIDVLISDVVMPQISGNELEEILRKERPRIKTLFLSGYPQEAMRNQGKLKPGARFISKPSPMQELLVELRALLDE